VRLTFKPQLLNQAVAFLEIVGLFWSCRQVHLLGVFFYHAPGAEQRRVRTYGLFDYLYPAVRYAGYVPVIVKRDYSLLQHAV